MKKKRNKLSVERDTIRTLAAVELHAVAGAVNASGAGHPNSCVKSCPTDNTKPE